MAADPHRYLIRAAEAKRSSKRVELVERFDPQAPGVWLELVRDVAAVTNSGGGVVVLSGDVEEEQLHEELARYAEPEFEAFELHDITRAGRQATAIVVEGVANTPLVFTRTGRYRSVDGDEHVTFARGGLYFRHGAKSEKRRLRHRNCTFFRADTNAPFFGYAGSESQRMKQDIERSRDDDRQHWTK